MRASLRERLIRNAKRNGKKMNPNGTKLADIIAARPAKLAAAKAALAAAIARSGGAK